MPRKTAPAELPPIINEQYEYVSVDNLKPHPKNVRQADLGAIYESIKANGFFGACVAQRSTGHILCGNHRFLAAREHGIPAVPVVYVDVDDDRALRIMLADNQTSDIAANNTAALAELLSELAVTPLGLSGTAFDGDDLDQLISDLALQSENGIGGGSGLLPDADTDAIPDDAPTRCKAGELWALGNHRLIVGDCRDAETVARLLNGEKINVCVTSPPYASQRKYDEESGFKPIPPDEYGERFAAVQRNIADHLAPDGSYFLNIKEHCEDGQRHLYVKDLTIAHVRQWGWMFVDEFCWRDTKNGVPGGWDNRFKDAWEPVFHFARGNGIKFHPLANGTQSGYVFDYSAETKKASTGSGLLGSEKATPFEDGIARPSNVLEIAAASTGGHSAAYPVALPEFFIKAFSDAGDTIYDPFMGSGTTLIAAEQNDRRAYGCEISPKYADVILARWEKATGKTAELIEP